jgi:hypothetical protein
MDFMKTQLFQKGTPRRIIDHDGKKYEKTMQDEVLHRNFFHFISSAQYGDQKAIGNVASKQSTKIA